MSAKYNYVVKAQNQGTVDVSIDMPDNPHVVRFFLEMEPDGKAKLTLTDAHGHTISYAGEVTKQI
jgi:hypothetical protein